MKVRTKLTLNTFVIMLLAGGLLAVVYLSSAGIREASREHEFARGIQEAVSELNLVMYEYLLSYKERAKEQWWIKFSSIGESLKHPPAAAPGLPGEPVAIAEVRRLWVLLTSLSGEAEFLPALIHDEFKTLGNLFEAVNRNFDAQNQILNKLGTMDQMRATMDLEAQIIDHLLIKSQSIIRDASRVAANSKTRLEKVQKTAELFIFGFVGFVIASILFTSTAVVRSISGPIRKLIRGTEEFGSGNLDYRISLKSRDELGQLGRAFDSMSSTLKEKIEALACSNKDLKEKNDQIQMELDLATRIHKTLIPESVRTERADIAVNYLPMSCIGGDYAKFHFVDENRLIFIIADVTGHGVGAALLVNRLHSEFEHLCKAGKEPGGVLKQLNEFISVAFEGTQMYLSAFCGLLDFREKMFRYSNYGHPPQYMYHAKNNAVLPMDSQTTLLGVLLDDELIYQREFRFSDGDKLLLFTDGILEAKNGEEELYGKERIEDFLKQNYMMPPSELNVRLLRALDEFKSGDFKDDIFLLTIQINQLQPAPVSSALKP